MPLLMPLLMGQSTSSCKQTDKRPLVKLERGADLDFTPGIWPRATIGRYTDDFTDPIDEILHERSAYRLRMVRRSQHASRLREVRAFGLDSP